MPSFGWRFSLKKTQSAKIEAEQPVPQTADRIKGDANEPPNNNRLVNIRIRQKNGGYSFDVEGFYNHIIKAWCYKSYHVYEWQDGGERQFTEPEVLIVKGFYVVKWWD